MCIIDMSLATLERLQHLQRRLWGGHTPNQKQFLIITHWLHFPPIRMKISHDFLRAQV